MINDKLPLLFKTGTNNNISFWILSQEEPFKCSVCGELIEGFSCPFIIDWTKEGVKTNFLHFDLEGRNCLNDWVKHPLSVTQNRFLVNFTEVIPPKAIPVIIRPPSFSPVKSDVSVFEPDKLRSGKTTDRRRHVPLLDGDAPVTIGAPDRERLEGLERPIEDVSSFLEDLKTGAKNAIEEKNKGLLTDGKK